MKNNRRNSTSISLWHVAMAIRRFKPKSIDVETVVKLNPACSSMIKEHIASSNKKMNNNIKIDKDKAIQ